MNHTQEPGIIVSMRLRTTFRLAVAGIILATVGHDLVATLLAPRFSLAATTLDFFSYFTNQSNLFAAAVLITSVTRRDESHRLSLLRGAAVVYMATTAVVVQLLLGGGLAGFVVHIVAPLAVIADWIIWAAPRPLGARAQLLWLAYPLLWLVYTLIHGAASGWYPYHFVDPHAVGAAGMATYLGVITLIIAVIARLVVLRTRRAGAHAAAAAEGAAA